MEMKDIILKVNYYAKLSKERELTHEETKDRKRYREMYLDKFRDQVRGHLDNVKVVDEDGKELDFKKIKKKVGFKIN